MILTIDFDKAKLLKITPIDYFFLECIKNNIPVDTMVSTGYLQELGYLNLDSTSVSVKYLEFFNRKEYRTFEDVYNLYPVKGGKRVLKAKAIATSDGDYCLKKFKIYQRTNINIADNMYKGLMNEIFLRNKNNSQEYQQDIRTWFNQRTWEKYQDLEIEKPVERIKRI